MDNPETLATWGPYVIGRRQKKLQQKNTEES
jgi:hypothetical protein